MNWLLDKSMISQHFLHALPPSLEMGTLSDVTKQIQTIQSLDSMRSFVFL